MRYVSIVGTRRLSAHSRGGIYQTCTIIIRRAALLKGISMTDGIRRRSPPSENLNDRRLPHRSDRKVVTPSFQRSAETINWRDITINFRSFFFHDLFSYYLYSQSRFLPVEKSWWSFHRRYAPNANTQKVQYAMIAVKAIFRALIYGGKVIKSVRRSEFVPWMLRMDKVGRGVAGDRPQDSR